MLLPILAFVVTLFGILGLGVAAFAGLGAIPILGLTSVTLLGLAISAFLLDSAIGTLILGAGSVLIGFTGLGLWLGQIISAKLK